MDNTSNMNGSPDDDLIQEVAVELGVHIGMIYGSEDEQISFKMAKGSLQEIISFIEAQKQLKIQNK